MFDILSPLFSFIRLSTLMSYKGVSIFFLMILFVFSISVFGDFGYMHALGSTVCDRQTFSLVDCPRSLSNDEATDRDHGGENIEQQIPLVIPFP